MKSLRGVWTILSGSLVLRFQGLIAAQLEPQAKLCGGRCHIARLQDLAIRLILALWIGMRSERP